MSDHNMHVPYSAIDRGELALRLVVKLFIQCTWVRFIVDKLVSLILESRCSASRA